MNAIPLILILGGAALLIASAFKMDFIFGWFVVGGVMLYLGVKIVADEQR